MRRIGKYDIIREIGQGGMGTVYQAYDPFRDRFVALKIPRVPPSSQRNEPHDYERLFYNEINTASYLNHPNIIQIHDAGVNKGINYIAMEYVAGGTALSKYCKPDHLLPVELVGQILLKCTEALDYAHRKGVIHRDIKPGNIMLKDEREVKIADFGLALLIDADLADTHKIPTMGSPLYMAPERFKDEGFTHQSDIYSLGVVMYEALTGRPPFEADNLGTLTHLIMTKTPAAPSSLRSHLSPAIDKVVFRAMAKDPDERYESMMEFAADLSTCFQELDSPMDSGTTESRTEKLKKLPFLQDFGDAEIWELLRWSKWQEFEEGEAIILEGATGDAIYILVSGHTEVLKGDNVVAVMQSGEFIGEIAFLTKCKRTATVRAKGHSTVLCISASQIERASQRCQILFQRLLISTLTDRLIKTTSQYADQSVSAVAKYSSQVP